MIISKPVSLLFSFLATKRNLMHYSEELDVSHPIYYVQQMFFKYPMLQISILLKIHSSGNESDNEGTGNVHNEM